MKGKDDWEQALREQARVMAKKRKCHACGKPTHNYWCAACHKKRRARYGIAGNDSYGESE